MNAGHTTAQFPVYEGTRYTVCRPAPGYLQIGCQEHKFTTWANNWVKLARVEQFTEAQVAEYAGYYNILADIFNEDVPKLDTSELLKEFHENP